MRLPQALAPLRRPAFRWQFIARSTSSFGDNLVPVTLTFAVLRATGSTADLGLVLAAQAIPLIAFLLVGGVWADRLPRQRVMMASDVVRCITQGALAAMFILGHPNLPLIVVIQIFNGAATAFFQPASTSLTALTATPSEMQQANALISLQYNVSGILGPLCAGLLFARFGAGFAFAADAFTFAASGLSLFMLKLPEQPLSGSRQRQSFTADLGAGWREVVTRPWVWASIAGFAASQFLMAMFFVLGPAIARQRLGGPVEWSWIVAAVGTGQIAGSVLALRLRPRRLLLASKLVELLFVPLAVLLAAGAPIGPLIAAALVAGASLSLPDALWYTALQQHIPPHALSRVASFDYLGSQILRPLGYLGAAVLAATLGVAGGMLAGAGLLAVTMLGSLLLRDIRELHRTDEPPRRRGHAPGNDGTAPNEVPG